MHVNYFQRCMSCEFVIFRKLLQLYFSFIQCKTMKHIIHRFLINVKMKKKSNIETPEIKKLANNYYIFTYVYIALEGFQIKILCVLFS